MADDLAWDDDEFEVPDLAVTGSAATKFDDEEDAPKKGGKKGDKKGKGAAVDDDVLADPLAEKLRQQRLQEESDLASAREAFGGAGKNLDEMVPKTEAEFNEYAELLAAKYLRTFSRDKLYVHTLKALIKAACITLGSAEVKDLESGVVAVRNQKVKEEKDATQKKKTAAAAAKPKATLKVDNDLDDAVYAVNNDDDYDFM